MHPERPAGAASAWKAPFISAFEHAALGEHFAGAHLTRFPGSIAPCCAHENPVLNLSQALLAPERGFLEPLSRIYAAPLEEHATQLVLVQGMTVSGAFLTDPLHRSRSLEGLCAALLHSPALLISYPPATFWQASGPDAQFRLHGTADKDLLLCMLMGRLGFAQLCDDMLRRPIPLLIRPWSVEQGLLAPAHLPTKSYSQSLCVERIGERRLLLFDKADV